jgi:hypothetical protein
LRASNVALETASRRGILEAFAYEHACHDDLVAALAAKAALTPEPPCWGEK